MDLVTTLKQQHQMLAEIIERLGTHVSNGDAPRVRITIEELRQALRAHVDLSEARLYPPLLASPLADEESRSLAGAFSKEMAPLTASLKTLSDFAANTDLDVAAFGTEWKPLAETVTARLEAEQQTMWPLYHRVVGKNSLLLRRTPDGRVPARGAA